MRSKLLATLALSASACGSNPPAEPPPQAVAPNAASTITGRDWVLVSLGGDTLTAALEKAPTVRFDPSNFRATGFAGCNRYFANYALRGDSLTFASIGATKMFCAETNDLERNFLATLDAASTYHVSDSVLVLRTRDGKEARFRPAGK